MRCESTARSRVRALLSVGTAIPLTRIERRTLLVLTTVATGVGIILMATTDGPSLPSSLFQLAITAAFALFTWSAVSAALALIGAMALSFSFGVENITLLVLAVAVGCVVRVGTVGLVVIYAGAFLLSSTVLVEGAAHLLTVPGFVSSWTVGAASGAIGWLLRLAAEREQRLHRRLESQAQAEQEASKAERLRIADELHDVIAHDLTIIAMHARVLDEQTTDSIRLESQRTIRDHARKALDDLRRVVENVNTAPLLAEAPVMSLDETCAAISRELTAAQYTVRIQCSPEQAELPRVVDGALARILHESATNILKHGEPGIVDIVIQVSDQTAKLTVRSPIGRSRHRHDISSGGYGTVRMTTRTRQLGGEFYSGEKSGDWIVSAYLPIQ